MKSILKWIMIIVGGLIVVFIGIGLFLMISPGTKVFGIEYINKTQKSKWTDKTLTVDSMSTDSIYIYTKNVPVKISYVANGSMKLHFVQNYTGYTNTKIEYPDVVCSTDESGNIIIKTYEYEKVLFGTNNSGYYFDISIPVLYTNKNIYINSSNSKVKMIAEENVLASLNNLSINTKNEISFSGQFQINDDLVLKSSKRKVVVPQSVSLFGNVESSIRKTLVLKNSVAGDINVEGSSSGINFKSCNNLNVETKMGNVISNWTGSSVLGIAKIVTKNGDVTLQHVVGNVSITTKSGNVLIGENTSSVKGFDSDYRITTTSGDVKLYGYYPSSIGNIETSSGSVSIGTLGMNEQERLTNGQTTINSVTISTTRGKVKIEKVTNAKITTDTSSVEIEKVLGNATIKTDAGNVKLKASGAASDVNVSSKSGKIYAYTLGGKTNLKTKDKIYAEFVALTDAVVIAGRNEAINVVVPDSVAFPPKYYKIICSKKSATVDVNGSSKTGKKLLNYTTISDSDLKNLITITSKYGKIKLLSKSNA